ncbi:MAG: 16S rRNA (cytidine(1402)-2'-O)-methyltransferase [Cytophagales bacterium]|nr:16S rRNA (cytidine(1402)-2'-O)-methyltransferase [Bernardetiaceae bacterium]MDW8205321.1 16S rRNA (cytidine(1402)-2'-O)-methyltransferase [Cytophagales bacterium]
MLTVVPTPIGNLEDITLRALRVLRQADFVIAEDTRVSGNLLKHFDIKKPLLSFHAANEHKALESILTRLKEGQKGALVSDAGTPGISDPGFLLIRACIREGIAVECLPGPTAFVPALVASGLPCDVFTFWGFLPHKKGRHTQLVQIAHSEHTIVLYESPHRLLKLLEELQLHCGADRPICVAREISKLHEEMVRGTVAEVLAYFSQKAVKGEIVVVVAGKTS